MPSPLVGFIIDENVLAGIPFYSWEAPRYSRSVAYDDVAIRGRSEPHVFYSHTDTRVWSFDIHLAVGLGLGAEFLGSVTPLSSILEYGNPATLKLAENFIHSMVMPDYGEEVGGFSVVKPPHIARVGINAMFDARGTIRNLGVVYSGPYEIVTGLPHRIDITFELHEQKYDNVDPDGYRDIRLGIPSPF